MFSTPFTFNASSGINYAQQFITAANITDSTQQTAITNLVADLTTYGLLAKCYAFWPLVGGTAAKHKFNLMNPVDTDAGFRLTFNGSVTHSSSGINGSSASYCNTFWTPSVELGSTNRNVSLMVYTNSTGFANIYPTDLSVTGLMISQYLPPASSVKGVLANVLLDGDSSNTAGCHIMTGNDSGGTVTTKRFINGSLVLTNSGAGDNWTGNVGTGPMYLLAENNLNAGAALSQTERTTCTAGIFQNLSDTQAGNLRTAIQAYNTTLGRQV